MTRQRTQAAEESSGMPRRTFLKRSGLTGIALVGSSAVGAAIASCTSSTSSGGGSAKQLVVATASSPPGFDQEYFVGPAYADQGANLGASLTNWKTIPGPVPGSLSVAWRATDPVPNTVPSLAKSWTTSADGRTYTFRLPRGVKSSAGNELTAEDVKWTFDRATGLKAIGEFLNGVQNLSQTRVVDRYTVEMILSAATVDFEMTMNDIFRRYIIDSTEAKKHATSSDPWATGYLKTHLPAYGPYFLESFVPGQQVTWVANKTFPQPAKINKVTLQVVPDSASRLSALTSGAVQVAEELTPTELANLQKSSGSVRLWSFSNNAIAGVLMNLAASPLNNKLVRQALSYAVPYDAVVSDIFKGFAVKSYGPATSLAGGVSGSAFPYTYDIGKAKSLLAQAGLSKGFSTTYAYDSSDPVAEQVGVLLQTNFRSIGVHLTLNGMTTAGWNSALDQKKAPMIYWNVGADVPDLYYQLNNFYRAGAGTNFSNYSNPALDKLTQQAGATTDPGSRLRLANEGLKELMADPAWLWLAQPNYVVATSKNVTGMNWYVQTTRYNYVDLT